MRKIKISIAVAPQLAEEISYYVNRKARSHFIEKALQNELKRIKRDKLIQAYRESAKEAENENQFFEGAIGEKNFAWHLFLGTFFSKLINHRR